MIKGLKRDGKTWTWRNANNSTGTYYTDNNGEGIFFQSDRNGEESQLVGTCQFSACATESGMRRKLNKLFDEFAEDPVKLRNKL